MSKNDIKKRKSYAIHFAKDPVARKQVAILRLAGLTCEEIAALTGRNLTTIYKEIKRDEHKKLLQRFVRSIAKRQLDGEAYDLVGRALEA